MHIALCYHKHTYGLNSVIERNTGINTGIPVLVFSNTEIPVLPNMVGIGGPNRFVKRVSFETNL